jgi:hypothetical protein
MMTDEEIWEMIEPPRTTADIVEDLVEFLKEYEWVEEYRPCGRGCCGEFVTECPSCGTPSGAHEESCKLSSLLKEADAFVSVEREVA